MPGARASSGQTFVNYLPLTNAVAVSAGYNHNLALKSDGTVFSWGAVTTLPAANSNFAAVAAGYSQSLGLRSNGTVVAWGSGTLPVAPADLTNAASIHVAKGVSSLVMNCFAIRSNSTLVGWNNNYLQAPPSPISPRAWSVSSAWQPDRLTPWL